MSRPWVIGMTGASGAVYGVRLVQEMLRTGQTVHLVVTDAGWRVLHDELGWNAAKRREMLAEHLGGEEGQLVYHPIQDIGASIASGSFRTQGMVIVPCSMGTLAGLSRGASDNLLERAADVMLKEGRRLIVVPRETPLHAVHLENMLTLARMGVRILPAMPGFYHKPQSLNEIVDFLVGKVMDAMEIEHKLYKRWGEHNGD
ncbi:flavin prenyltransferase UbiX [Paenibacillus sp. J31TS4]|uniref:UbiX family flavin prenyltransferase n=1 Tax=Paenibacillus sp. J31TS4 TaxID=2807195 RepID=UPI001B0A27A2|nr:flavin prenyltransferase UbiX [Paenibacillus sp. J31TS4]GIP37472.1 flavin prenyltransferase UbiX [Paenibacillus sp. J31TS4]